MGSQDSGEAVLLKEHLREPFSDEVRVEKMLSKDQGGEVGLDVEALTDSLLVAFLCWQQVEQRREVTAVVHLIPNKCMSDMWCSVSIRNHFSCLVLPLLRLCLHDAVRNRPRLFFVLHDIYDTCHLTQCLSPCCACILQTNEVFWWTVLMHR